MKHTFSQVFHDKVTPLLQSNLASVNLSLFDTLTSNRTTINNNIALDSNAKQKITMSRSTSLNPADRNWRARS